MPKQKNTALTIPSARTDPNPRADVYDADPEYSIEDNGASSTALAQRPKMLTRATASTAAVRYQSLGDRAKKYAAQSRAKKTIRAYDSDWRDFVAWCEAEDRQPLPAQPETVADYVAFLAEIKHYKLTTIDRRVASISVRHQLNGFLPPTQEEMVRTVVKGIRRDDFTNKHLEQKEAAITEIVEKMVDYIDRRPPASAGQTERAALARLRDRAIMLVGFGGAMRRDELCRFDVRWVEFSRNGMIITLPKSKTNQEGRDRNNQPEEKVYEYAEHKEYCPTRALQAYMRAARIERGFVFRQITKGGQLGDGTKEMSGQAIANLIKECAAAIGLDPRKFGGHSLRAGFVTQAELSEIPEAIGMKQTGHKSTKVYRGYARQANRWRNSPIRKLGL